VEEVLLTVYQPGVMVEPEAVEEEQ